jgi:hypothetical protein
VSELGNVEEISLGPVHAFGLQLENFSAAVRGLAWHALGGPVIRTGRLS